MAPTYTIRNLTLEECDIIALALDGLLFNADVSSLIDTQLVESLFERFDEIADVPEVEPSRTNVSVERDGNLLRVQF